jgi:hypothetical protein
MTFEITLSASTARRCGDCQLCCRLLPVRSLGKGAGERCKHQRHHKGCAVYAKLMRVAPECRFWNCRWLVNDDAGDLRRPDRSHYVIDIMPDYVTLEDADGVRTAIEVVQIWIDPAYPDAHRDPALRAWLERQGKAGLVRYDNREGIVIMPPQLCADGQWHERGSNRNLEKPHELADVVGVLSGEKQP